MDARYEVTYVYESSEGSIRRAHHTRFNTFAVCRLLCVIAVTAAATEGFLSSYTNRIVIIRCDCVQAEAENGQLQAQLKQLKIAQDQKKMCIEQLLSRLQDAEGRLQKAEALRQLEQNTAEALRQQVNAYREDFEGERLDRHRAQERVVSLERQLAALKHQVRVPNHGREFH